MLPSTLLLTVLGLALLLHYHHNASAGNSGAAYRSFHAQRHSTHHHRDRHSEDFHPVMRVETGSSGEEAPLELAPRPRALAGLPDGFLNTTGDGKPMGDEMGIFGF